MPRPDALANAWGLLLPRARAGEKRLRLGPSHCPRRNSRPDVRFLDDTVEPAFAAQGTAGFGGWNHRGSIFRLLVGSTLPEAATVSTWGVGSNASREVRGLEHALERDVTSLIGAMSVLWLAVDDAPGPDSPRGYIERNSIGLLSNLAKDALDRPSPAWRGHRCVRGKALVRDSGLWNQNHVEQEHNARFLDVLENLIAKVEAA